MKPAINGDKILGQPYMDMLILFSLLVLMGISTNQQRIYFFAGYLRLAMNRGKYIGNIWEYLRIEFPYYL